MRTFKSFISEAFEDFDEMTPKQFLQYISRFKGHPTPDSAAEVKGALDNYLSSGDHGKGGKVTPELIEFCKPFMVLELKERINRGSYANVLSLLNVWKSYNLWFPDLEIIKAAVEKERNKK